MKKIVSRRNAPLLAFCALVACTMLFDACTRNFPNDRPLKHFTQKNLVASNSGYGAAHIDTTLINAWGIAFNPTGVPWVNSQRGSVSEIYDKEGATLRPPVWIPGPVEKISGNPTGIVFNGSGDFVLSNGQPAKFLFVGVDGVFSGWNANAGDSALVIANNSATSAYTGLAIAAADGANYLYAADFRGKKIDVWDKNFNAVSWSFSDPSLPDDYSPYNVQPVGDWLYVTYAKPGADGHEQFGSGLGVVNIFDTKGGFVKRFTDGGALNAPWGVTAAASDFFKDNDDESMSNAAKTGEQMVLVGNFGDGHLNVYTAGGKYVGALKSRGQAIVIPGLWAITFPPASATSIDPERLYFAAGPNGAADGLFGYLEKQ